MATNIAEFISVLRRIRDEIHPDIEATYASALVLKQAVDAGNITLNEDLTQFALEYQNFLTKYNTIDIKVTSANNSADSAGVSALLASQKADEIKGITAVATTIAEGFPANVSYNSTSGQFTFGIPVGNTGQKGEKGDSFAVNSSGLTAERTLYDNRLKGWSFLDLTLKLLYFKLSDTNADWSTGFPFGKGDTGNGIDEIVFLSTTDASGLPHKSGATDTYRINYTDTAYTTFAVYNGLNASVTSPTTNALAKINADGTIGNSNIINDASGNVLVIGAGRLGYGAGSGGTVTQLTSKSTAVTLNKPTGRIVTNNASLAAGASIQFVLNNSLISITDTVYVCMAETGASLAGYNISTMASNGYCYVYLTNKTASTLSDAIGINFVVIKGVNS